MNSTELMAAFSSEMGNISQQIVSDAEKFRYMDDAYRRFVRLTGGIADETSVATQVAVTTGEQDVALHPSILQILRATRASDEAAVEVINYTDIQRLRLKLGQPGGLRYLMIGAQPKRGTVYGEPVEDDVLNLTIQRLPLTHITTVGQEFTDVDDDHHLALLDWMKALAYKRPGAEFFNPTLSAAFSASFAAYCAQVKAELATTRHKIRSTSYGGY